MSGASFTVSDPSDEGFYLIVAAGEATVYEQYDDAVADIQAKLNGDTDGFLAEVAIDAATDDDVAVTLQQVSWQQVIADLPAHSEVNE
jgi:hypothetical protein